MHETMITCVVYLLQGGIHCYLPWKLVVAFGFLDKDYVEQEQVEEVLKWFITMSSEGLFPNIATFVVVYGYGITCKLVDCFLYFGECRLVSSAIILYKTGLGKKYFVCCSC